MSAAQHSPTGQLERLVGLVLRIGLRASALCLGLGLALQLMNLEPPAARIVLQVGVLTLLATPILRVIASVAHYFVIRDWAFVALTMTVLLELGLSVVAALVFNRRL
jgi:uncharacterized membrane protein